MSTESKEDPSPELSPAEQAKKSGNDAFLAKNYREAIEHYTKAIELDNSSAIFFSNRSACYASLKEWKNAYEDALASISKDPKFIKGYYRLSSAQIELQMFDDAETTLRAALALEPNNEVVMRQLKNLKAKKNTAGKVVKKPAKKLDEAQVKEAMELQEQLGAYHRDLRSVRAQLSAAQRESRMNAVTAQQIQALDSSVPLYRSVGKAFLLTPRDKIESKLEEELAELTKNQRDFTDRSEYLERRITSHVSNLRELTGQ